VLQSSTTVYANHTQRAMNAQYANKGQNFPLLFKETCLPEVQSGKNCSLPSNTRSLDLFTLLTTNIHSNKSAVCVWSEDAEGRERKGGGQRGGGIM